MYPPARRRVVAWRAHPRGSAACFRRARRADRTGLRDKAILEVFYSTGLRLAEPARLTGFDLDHRNRFVRVNRGKGGKDRIVPIGAKACGFVREYLAQVRLECKRHAERLYLSGSYSS